VVVVLEVELVVLEVVLLVVLEVVVPSTAKQKWTWDIACPVGVVTVPEVTGGSKMTATSS
jgi:hypothetical protein